MSSNPCPVQTISRTKLNLDTTESETNSMITRVITRVPSSVLGVNWVLIVIPKQSKGSNLYTNRGLDLFGHRYPIHIKLDILHKHFRLSNMYKLNYSSDRNTIE